MRGFFVILLLAIGCSSVMSRPKGDVKLNGELDLDLPKVVSTVADLSKTFTDLLIDGAVSGGKLLKDEANYLEEGFKNNVIPLMGNVLAEGKNTADHYGEVFKSTAGNLHKGAKDLANGLHLTEVVSTVADVGKTLTGPLIDAAASGGKLLKDEANYLEEGFKNNVIPLMGNVLAEGKNTADHYGEVFKSTVGNFGKDAKHLGDGLEKDLKFNVNHDVKLEASTPDTYAHYDDTTGVLPEVEIEDLENDVDKTDSSVEGLISNDASLTDNALQKDNHAADGHNDLKFYSDFKSEFTLPLRKNIFSMPKFGFNLGGSIF